MIRRVYAFFFSSRRRHTRWPRNWSSDVCSSDLQVGGKTISKEAAAAIEKGNAASKEKKYAEAEESYLKALPELPDNPSLLSNLALNYYFDNKPDQRSEERRVGKESMAREGGCAE